MKAELLLARIENTHAENVRGQEIGRKLQAFELRIDGPSQRFGQGRLPRAGKIFEQDMTAGRQRGEYFPE